MKEREAEIEAIGKRKAVLQAYKATLGPLVDIISKNMDENINQQVSKQSEMNRSEAKRSCVQNYHRRRRAARERSRVHCDRPSGSEGGAVSIKPSAAESRTQRKPSAAVGGDGSPPSTTKVFHTSKNIQN